MRKDGLPQKPSWTPNRETAAIAPLFRRHLERLRPVPGAEGVEPVCPCSGQGQNSAQGEGIGSWVLTQVLQEADAQGKAVSVTALKHSDANRFYLRHGFVLQAEGEWDLYYLRPARPADRS